MGRAYISGIGQRPPPGPPIRSKSAESKTGPGTPGHDYVKCIMSNRRSRWAAPKAKPPAPVGAQSRASPAGVDPPAMTAPPNPVPELVCGLGSNWNLNLT